MMIPAKYREIVNLIPDHPWYKWVEEVCETHNVTEYDLMMAGYWKNEIYRSVCRHIDDGVLGGEEHPLLGSIASIASEGGDQHGS